jgi:membrane protein DedA with SNARE-associated domain
MDGFFLELLHRYGPGVVGLIILLESTGLPLPGESLLIASALYASATGKLDIWLVVGIAAVGAVIGDNIGYLVGRSLGNRLLLRYGQRIGLTEQRMKLGYYLFRRHGGKVVFFGRFIAVLRTFAAVLAGASGMHWKQFLIYNTLGGVTWCALYGLGAYMLGTVFRQLAGPFAIIIGAIALVCIGGGLWFVKRNEARLLAAAEQDGMSAVPL